MPRQARIVRPEKVEEMVPKEVTAERWTGKADVRRVHEALGSDELKVNAVFMEAGARSRPHSHSRDQVLHYVSGAGIVAVDGGEDQRVEAGHFVLLPGGVPHMHGATDEGSACHISLMLETDTDFGCPIPGSWERWRQEA